MAETLSVLPPVGGSISASIHIAIFGMPGHLFAFRMACPL